MNFKHLWATWRMAYISKVNKPKVCVFCNHTDDRNNDDKNYILYRGVHCYIVLNLYPYNNGHAMVIPYRHISDFTKLADEELLEMMKLKRTLIKIISEVMTPEGFNSGMNIGRPAGAGIADHLHLHVVPRWTGDTNFMPTIANVRVISESLNDTYNKLKSKFDKVEQYQ